MATNILAIESATEACSVAVLCDGHIYTQFTVSPREHTKKILPMLKKCLIDAHLNLLDIDVLAFGRGPGSFTGVRIAVGIAQGLALGANLPMVGISSLLTMAQGTYRKLGIKQVLVAIDARMNEIYSACYQLKPDGSWQGKNSETVLKPDIFLDIINNFSGQWAIAGTGWSVYSRLKTANLDLLESGISFPDAQDMLPLALQAWKKGKLIRIEDARPVYLRNLVGTKKNTCDQ